MRMGFKQAIIVRGDLGMGKGKIAAQASHASVSAYRKTLAKDPEAAESWDAEGQKKIVLKAAGEPELLALFDRMKREIPCALIRDAGHTQVEPGSITCFAAGPARDEEIDRHTKGMKLL